MKIKTVGLVASVMLGVIILFTEACTHDPFLDPNELNGGKPSIPGCTDSYEICFESSVLPIFRSYCAREGCHDAGTREDGYVLDSYINIVRKGITPFKASDSEIYEVLLKTGDDQMPPDAPLTQAQKDSIKLWINQGAKNTVNCNCYCDPNLFTYSLDIEPIINNACVSCHKPGYLGGGINLVGYANVKIQADNGFLLGTITHAPTYEPMPKGGKLSECEIDKIQNWIEAGALNN